MFCRKKQKTKQIMSIFTMYSHKQVNLKNMTTKKITSIISGLIMVLALTISPTAFAGNGKNKDKKPHNNHTKNKKDKKKTDSIPLDGGLSILVIGAAAFGAKKLHDNK